MCQQYSWMRILARMLLQQKYSLRGCQTNLTFKMWQAWSQCAWQEHGLYTLHVNTLMFLKLLAAGTYFIMYYNVQSGVWRCTDTKIMHFADVLHVHIRIEDKNTSVNEIFWSTGTNRQYCAVNARQELTTISKNVLVWWTNISVIFIAFKKG